ncbi:MAG: hypothetical protein LBI29_03810 [Rickettsiales bacterium]|jgi:hypothetical protein|nr:hypothetical protein [Rickettsiales bacterium]
MERHRKFIFDSYSFDPNSKILSLRYFQDDELFFLEAIEFPSGKHLDGDELEVLDGIFRYLHLAAGISYYKLFISREIEVRTTKLSEEQAEFFNNFYRNGLGEFSYKNNIIDLSERINFPHSSRTEKNSRLDFNLEKRTAIAIGGGKDSLVTLEIARKHMDNLLLCSVGKAKPIVDLMKMTGLEYFNVNRSISSNLLDLNKRLDEIGGYNGHVPISGIIAFILLAASIIQGFDRILMSNERSANIGNLNFNGVTINHQWSKSFEFEKSINSFIKKHILSGFEYLSFLRPLSEIHIAKLFANFRQYHSVFASCNGNFKIENKTGRWCCHCPKCRFVFLMLAVYLNKNDMIEIFGMDLLDDETQLDGFLELCGVHGHKPFECVGEIEESIYAISNLNKSFKDDYIVKKLHSVLPPVNSQELERRLFTLSREHLLGQELETILNSVLGLPII